MHGKFQEDNSIIHCRKRDAIKRQHDSTQRNETDDAKADHSDGVSLSG